MTIEIALYVVCKKNCSFLRASSCLVLIFFLKEGAENEDFCSKWLLGLSGNLPGAANKQRSNDCPSAESHLDGGTW